MSEAFSWRPEYGINIAEIDRQHQNLFRIVQNLQLAISAGRGHEVIEAALTEVVNYTIHHFATEEELMQRHGFPGITEHRVEHNALTLEIFRVQGQHAAGEAQAAEEFLKFLKKWLQEHTLKADKHYAEFLNAAGVT